jgi:hypothetical protein
MRRAIFRKFAIFIGVISIFCFPAAAAQVDEAVGLVTKVTGKTSPEINPFDEIFAGSTIVLTAGSIEFLHYPTCESITVQGGKLYLTTQSYNARDSLVTREKRRCPSTLRIRGDARVGGIVMRSGLAKLALAAKPSLYLTGKNRKMVTGLRFHLGNQLLLAARVDGPRFDWPENKAPLRAGNTYHLELMELTTVVRRIPFKVAKGQRVPAVIVAID